MITTYRGFYGITFNNYNSAGSNIFLFNKVKTLFYIPNIIRYIQCIWKKEPYYSFYGIHVNLIKIITRSSYRTNKYLDIKESALRYLSANGFIMMKKICSLENGDILSSSLYNEQVAYENMENTMRMIFAYNRAGEYVGDPEFALLLLKKGIVPEKAHPTNNVCSIGFCEQKQKWYGWSHRAMYGFGIGSNITKESCGFKPSTKEEFIQSIKDFYNDDKYEIVVTDVGVEISKKLSPEEEYYKCNKITNIEYFPEEFGRGEWTALTLDEAKEMAIDFADSVS